MNKNLLKSIGAVLVGFIFIGVSHTGTDAILESIGILPKGNLFVDTKLILLVIFYRTVFSFIGCYITALLAPHNPLRHSIILGAIGVALSTLGAIANTKMHLGPNWYAWTLVAISLPISWLAGKLYINKSTEWTKSYSITTKEITKEQIWKLFTDINNWHVWNEQIEFAKLDGKFEAGNFYQIKPKKGQTVKVNLLKVEENKHCLEAGNFPLAKMYYDHLIEETKDGLKITNTITVQGLLNFLWVQLVVKKIAAEMPAHVQQQIQVASKL